MARPGPETRGVETAIELFAGVFVVRWDLGGLAVHTFSGVVVPLLLVGEEFEHDNDEHGTTKESVVGGQLVTVYARVEKQDVGRSGDEPEKNLVPISYRTMSLCETSRILTFWPSDMKVTLKMNMPGAPT